MALEAYHTEVNLDGTPLRIYGDVSDVVIQNVSKTHLSLPENVRKAFRGLAHNLAQESFIALGQKTSLIRGQDSLSIRPTAYDSRTHIDEIGGSANSHSRPWNVQLSELVLEPTFNIYCQATDISNTHRHEVGHIMNAVFGHSSNGYFFRKAWRQDIQDYGGINRLIREGYGYYLHCSEEELQQDKGVNAGRGRGEVWADLWANMHGGGCKPEIAEIFPHCNKEIYGLVEKFDASTQGSVEHKLTREVLEDLWSYSRYEPQIWTNDKHNSMLLKRLTKGAMQYAQSLGSNYLTAQLCDFLEMVKRDIPHEQQGEIIYSAVHRLNPNIFGIEPGKRTMPKLFARRLSASRINCAEEYLYAAHHLVDTLNAIEQNKGLNVDLKTYEID